MLDRSDEQQPDDATGKEVAASSAADDVGSRSTENEIDTAASFQLAAVAHPHRRTSESLFAKNGIPFMGM